jgi:hypothetical protein
VNGCPPPGGGHKHDAGHYSTQQQQQDGRDGDGQPGRPDHTHNFCKCLRCVHELSSGDVIITMKRVKIKKRKYYLHGKGHARPKNG